MSEGSANELFMRAAAFAVEAHGHVRQARKGTDYPYVVHPLRVGSILDAYGYSDEAVAAGILHDTIEDAGVAASDLESSFGRRIADLVAAASEPDKTLPWPERKQQALERLIAESDADARAVIAADRLDNVRAIRETLALEGRETWRRFNAPREAQHAHYRAMARVLLEHEPNNLLFRTLDAETQALFPDRRRFTAFFSGKPLGNPHDARAYLADPIRQWKPEHSAQALAHAWIPRSDAPAEVDALLRSALGDYVLVEGFFERETPLGTKGRPSQTDLLLLLRHERGFAVAAVEGKALEPFGERVRDWNDGTPGKRARLRDLRLRLGLEGADVGDLRYQLLHRTLAALIEAERYGATDAFMFVHAFADAPESFADFAAFADAIGVGAIAKESLSVPKPLGQIRLRLGWASAPRNA
jgi:Domain of unknown function (DUF6946)/HD domain